MNHADIVKIKEHFEPFIGDKTLIIMKDEASVYTGKASELEKFKIYTLDRSIGPNNIKNDELFQKVKPKVYKSAGESKEGGITHQDLQLPQGSLPPQPRQRLRLGGQGHEPQRVEELPILDLLQGFRRCSLWPRHPRHPQLIFH